MTDTYTDRNRAVKQGFNTNEDEWGDPFLNQKAIDVFDAALDGYAVLTTTGGTYTLTATNGSSSAEAIQRILTVSGTLASDATIVVPENEKWYYVRNVTSGSYAVYVKNNSEVTSALVPQDSRYYAIHTDGTTTRSAYPSAIQSASGAPSDALTGNNGDFYLDTTNYVLYGPKAGGVWPTPGQPLVGAGGLDYNFDGGTSDADPGSGNIRLNNATPASATAAYISDVVAGGANVEPYLLSWDDSTSLEKGTLTLRSRNIQGTTAIYTVNSLTDNTAYVALNLTYVTGSGSFTSGNPIDVDFSRAGDRGQSDGFDYLFDTTTADADPGAGNLRFNNATPASVTAIYIDDSDRLGNDISAFLATIDDSTSAFKGTITVRSQEDDTVFAIYQLDGLTDNTGYFDLTVTYIAGNGTLSNAENISFLFSRTGDAGASGGFSYNFDTATADADPGSGNLRYNNAAPGSVTEIYIDDEDAGGADLSAYFATLDDSTSTVKGTIVVRSETTASSFAVYSLTATTDNVGYYTLTVTAVASNGTFSASENISFLFIRTGDKGDTGSSTDVSENFIATSGQTTFTLSNPFDYEAVYLNGSKQVETTDYTVSGNSVVFTSGTTSGASVQVVAFQNFNVANAITLSGSDPQYGVYYVTASNVAEVVAPSTSGYFLATQSTGAPPQWVEIVLGYPQAFDSGSVTAVAGNAYILDGGETLTLPASPNVGDTVVIFPQTDFTTSNATVARNGNNIMSSGTDLTLDLYEGLALCYTSGTAGWTILS